MNLFSNSRQLKETDIELLLSLLSGGCSYDQAKIILNLNKSSMKELTSAYFGSSSNIFKQIRKHLSDEQCLKLWMTLNKLKIKDIEDLIKRCLYPLFLIITSFISLIFFRMIFIPRIRVFFDSGKVIYEFIQLDILILFLTATFTVIFLIVTIIWLSLKNPNTRNFVYLKLHEKFSDNLLTVNSTSKFAYILSECINQGIATQTALDIALMFYNEPFVVLLAQRCINKLQSGQPFTHSILSVETDRTFKIFMQMGLFSNRVTEHLNHYITFSKLHIKKIYSRIIYVLYTIAYMQFILTAYLLYQIIQIPLNTIATKF